MAALVLRWLDRLDPETRRRGAVWMLIGSLIGWPLTALTVARGEPQFILGLSWFAITLTALDVLSTTDVRREQDDDGTSEAT